jgi:hypothetical protein
LPIRLAANADYLQIELGGGYMRRLTKIVVVIGLPLAVLAWLVFYDNRVRSGFPRIEPGMSAAAVDHAVGGQGWLYRPCGKWGGNPPAGCVKEHVYPTLSGVWLVWLDADDKVIGKGRP